MTLQESYKDQLPQSEHNFAPAIQSWERGTGPMPAPLPYLPILSLMTNPFAIDFYKPVRQVFDLHGGLIISLLFIVTYVPAFLWACYAAWVQWQKFNYLRNNQMNGNERKMTVGFFFISLVNAYRTHNILVAALERALSGNIQDYSNASVVQIYVTINLLLGSFASCLVSWFVLSEHAEKIIGAIKKGDTDGHRFDIVEKKIKLRLEPSFG